MSLSEDLLISDSGLDTGEGQGEIISAAEGAGEEGGISCSYSSQYPSWVLLIFMGAQWFRRGRIRGRVQVGKIRP